MKQSIIKYLLVIAITAISLNCHAEKLFESLASNPHVESVYVGKAMMGMARGFLNNGKDKDTKKSLNAIKDINSIEIIDCEDSAAIKEIKSQAHKILANLTTEILLETRDGDEHTVIYRLISGKQSAASGMILETSEPGEYSLIYIDGVIDIDALTKK
ncbi:MAG: DUF4252 domain-containing protein [Bacteroides sp.]|nr:DUF4252 domain-containing protein [Bacteroides sp.]MCM1379789.1 DUF4252 domain-containing protein [Bacteroides sp.]MCM1446148.1 DUF4252 domain-containing protein [Prevotella sp.]